MKVRLLKNIVSEIPIPHRLCGMAGVVYDAVQNRGGAVCIVIGSEQLGVYPSEFEFVEGEPTHAEHFTFADDYAGEAK